MKKIILLFAIWAPTLPLKSQTARKNTYLVVRFEYTYDNSLRKPFYRIYAEPGNPFAKEVYSLVTYNADKKAINTGGSFFTERTDSTKILYNYFENSTEAILFLSQNNWELVTIYNQVTSGYEKERVKDDYFPYTTISSYPVYYFRKSIE